MCWVSLYVVKQVINLMKVIRFLIGINVNNEFYFGIQKKIKTTTLFVASIIVSHFV